ncbi:MAG: hypothetical protein IPG38_00770 [Chitinophagaceae bacterium]|nr:hypothetical protein [Chitinophagaceae bacterium]
MAVITKPIIAFIFFIAPLFVFSQQEIKIMSYNIRLDVKKRWRKLVGEKKR